MTRDRGLMPGGQKLPSVARAIRKRLADGSVKLYYYHRKTGRPILGEPGTRAFEIAAIAAGEPKPGPARERRDFQWLIDQYQASPDWRALAKATKETRASYFRRILAHFAGIEMEDIDQEAFVPDLYAWRDELALISPMTADHAIDNLRALLSWAKERRIVRMNWAREIKRLTPSTHNRAELVWTPDLWETLLGAAAEDERQLLRFAEYTAAREADIPLMRWDQFDGQWLVYKPQKTARKTGVTVALPVHALPPFAALLEELPRSTEYILTTCQGLPWSTSNIKLRMRALKAKAFAGDPGRRFHDIRGTTISRLFAAGCTDAEVAAIDGHAIGRGTMLGRYAERSRQLALNAYQRWAAFEFSKEGGSVVRFKRPVSGL